MISLPLNRNIIAPFLSKQFINKFATISLRGSDDDESQDLNLSPAAATALIVGWVSIIILSFSLNVWITSRFVKRVLLCQKGAAYAAALSAIILVWVPISPTLSTAAWGALVIGAFTNWMGQCGA